MPLPTLHAKQLQAGVGFTCPYTDCGGKFIANPKRLPVTEAAAFTRALCCPYCARPARLPEEQQPRKPRRKR